MHLTLCLQPRRGLRDKLHPLKFFTTPQKPQREREREREREEWAQPLLKKVPPGLPNSAPGGSRPGEKAPKTGAGEGDRGHLVL